MRVHDKQINAENRNELNDQVPGLQMLEGHFYYETGITSRDLPLFRKQQNRN
ncbi:hypothetical protein [Shouchella patagoniensis]|uniref:hypothetical protein n=1 Tax=Shouchella patagoniensis TaxID=228576 RepID=UPI001474E92F|nr:hypothetical protein [Shouchella patagoniensis]